MDELIDLLRRDNEAFVDREKVEQELAELIDIELPITKIGPTWQEDPETGKKLLPQYSLGMEIAVWCHEWLRAYDTEDDESPQGLKFTKEQLRFLLWLYAIDEDGEFLFTMGVLQRLKGWGKDPLLAAVALVEWVGPCRFDHWEEVDGKKVPVGRASFKSLVQVAAVTQEQTTTTSDWFPVLMTERFKRKFNVKPGVELMRANGGRSKLQMVTSNPKAMEGKPSTFVILNEIQN